MAKIIRSHPLDGVVTETLSSTDGPLTLALAPAQNIWNLRLDPENKNLIQLVEDSLHIALPLTACTWVETDYLRLIWLGPDEWLLVGNDDGIFQRLKTALADNFALLTDWSHNLHGLTLYGERSLDTLTKLVALDIQRQVFEPGTQGEHKDTWWCDGVQDTVDGEYSEGLSDDDSN